MHIICSVPSNYKVFPSSNLSPGNNQAELLTLNKYSGILNYDKGLEIFTY